MKTYKPDLTVDELQDAYPEIVIEEDVDFMDVPTLEDALRRYREDVPREDGRDNDPFASIIQDIVLDMKGKHAGETPKETPRDRFWRMVHQGDAYLLPDTNMGAGYVRPERPGFSGAAYSTLETELVPDVAVYRLVPLASD